MRAKEFLTSGYRALELIKSYEAEIDGLSCAPPVNVIGEKVQSSPTGDKVAKVVEKIAALKEKISAEYLELLEIMGKMEDVINSVESKDEKLLLRLRYINYYRWDKIAVEMGYSERHIQRLHAKALMSVEIMLNGVPSASEKKIKE